jgi:hypothetical protein
MTLNVLEAGLSSGSFAGILGDLLRQSPFVSYWWWVAGLPEC